MLAGDQEKAALYAPEDPDYWLCPIDEDDRASPLCESILSNEMTGGGEIVERRRASRVGESETARPGRKPLDASEARCRLRHGFLPLTLASYIRLLDLAGRIHVEGKGCLDPALPPILERLGVTRDELLAFVEHTSGWFQRRFSVLPFLRDAGVSEETPLRDVTGLSGFC